MPTHLDMMMQAIDGLLVPGLQERGFADKLPHFRRKLDDRLHLLRVVIDDAGGSFVVDLGSTGSNGLKEDWPSLASEEITVAHLDNAARHRLSSSFFGRRFVFGPPAYHPDHPFGPDFYERIARKVLTRFDKEGEAWLRAFRGMPNGSRPRAASAVVAEMLDALRASGWTVELEPTRRPLPPELLARYGTVPELLREFAETVRECVRSDETAWFLTAYDYAGDGTGAFRWDEIERMTLDGDRSEDVRQKVTKFWNGLLPVLHDVSGDYVYLALCLDKESEEFGAIVRGDGLDFDGTLTVAPSVHGFFEQVIAVAKGDTEHAVNRDIADIIT